MRFAVRSIALGLGLTAVLVAAGPDYDRAKKLFNATEFEQSLKVLQAIPDKDGPVYELIGRNLFLLGDFKKSTEALEKAAQADPDNSEIALWAGRAFGRRAETSSVLTAPGFASRARQYFEKSVQLNPHNLEALSDLFEYYLEAPGFLGGGMDKARSHGGADCRPRRRRRTLEPGQAGGEAQGVPERRRAVAARRRALAPAASGGLSSWRGSCPDRAVTRKPSRAWHAPRQIAPSSPRLVYAKADIYIKNKYNLELAKTLLIRYMSMDADSPDDPPRSEAAKLLRQVQGS